MRRRPSRLIVMLFLVLVPVNISLAVEMGIITGSEKGTYYQFGLNLKELLQRHDIQLNVVTSNGSVENIYAVFKRPGTQVGIVQSDVLAFVARVQTDPALKKIAKKIKMVFPLYNEEVHLVGRKGIRGFEDLADRRVAVGEEGSGSYLTAKLLFEVSQVKPREMVNVGTTEALAQLKAGNIDAMFYVAGYPVKLFQEGIRGDDELDLIPIAEKNILEFYPRAEIPAGTYGWKSEPVSTVAVKAVLISYDFRTLYCDQVGKVAEAIYGNMEWLTQHGHPKWKSVDLNYVLKGWDQYDCVKKRLAKPAQAPSKKPEKPNETNPVMNAIKQFL